MIEKSNANFSLIPRLLSTTALMILILSVFSCTVGGETTEPVDTPTNEGIPAPSPSKTPTTSPRTPTTSPISKPTEEPVQTMEATQTVSPVPFPGEMFNSEILWDDVEPVEYLEDRCEYLRMRWDPNNSPPGTIVAPIMFHSVRKSGRPISDSTSISEEYFHNVLAHAKELGFETITTEELIGFLISNAQIPPRSMIMILDDRRPGVTERFIPFLVANDWTLTLGWIIEDQREYLWDWMETLAESGRLDVQSHGYWHRYIVEETSEEFLIEEIFDPIPILKEHFGYRPIAIIWPGGNFTKQSVQIAHEAEFQIGFSAYAHGPLLFNWIPQSEAEMAIGDPIMTLPRYWSPMAWRNLDQTVEISANARTHAIEQYPLEAEWYRQSCGGELPPPPT